MSLIRLLKRQGKVVGKTAAIFMSLILGAALAQAQVAPAAPPVGAAPAAPVFSTVPTEDGYVLGVGDVIAASVLGRTEFNSQVQIQADGTLQLPFLGTVKAADLTVLQFRENVKNALKKGGYYADPVINISVTTYASRYVIVLGEVGQPGMVPVDRNYRVSEILAKVGGPRDSGADYVSLRRASGEEIKLNINSLATGTLEQDPFVKPGDKLFVPKAETFYIYGQISRPGTVKLEPGMDLRKAIVAAGGLTTMGSEGKIKIIRDGKEIKKYSLTGPIKNGDVIHVGERFF
ncbi:MAG: SLBB domain-containing protein [Sphingobium sp.]|jgi:polysaccharide export outer membrane protein|nr:SLBB domain-containing protein [Sphingobium sp.]MCI1271138.1 SLBB domain-containing protein [Sphingobium sp.]MCI1754610.1 SLBB domain-containing protein [Sphingobium sp.]MCI2052050.1 SLBB domain-containing protein [Sphingobium sp.]